jgi:hypothetical protein
MKQLSLIILVTLVSTSAFAQPPIGVRAGVNFSNQQIKTNGDLETLETKTGFMLGMYFNAEVTDKIAIQPEIMFSGMGSELTSSDRTNVFNYLSIPVFFRYNLSRNVYLHAGPQFGVLLTARLSDGDNFVDIKETYKGTEWGANGGIGINIQKFDGGVRYYLGLSNIAKESNVADSYKNNAVQLYIGYRLSSWYDD